MENSRIKMVLFLDSVPTIHKNAKNGDYVNAKLVVDSATIVKCDLISKDFTSWEEVIDEIGDGAHVVNWTTSPKTYAKLAEDGSKIPAPGLMCDWTVEVRAIEAKRWEFDSNSGVKLKFVGLVPKAVDGESLKLEELDVVDHAEDDEEE